VVFAVVSSEEFLKHRPPRRHPEEPHRVSAILKALGDADRFNPPLAPRDLLLLVHDEPYVKMIEDACKGPSVFIDPDTYVTPDTCTVARYAVGAVILSLDSVMRGDWVGAYAVVRPPGHHAGRSGRALMAPTQGFCIFNNVAVGSMYALMRGARRVAILDVDVHHGNGTQEIFYDDPRVLYISLHQDPTTLYPGTGFAEEIGEGEGEGYNINIPLPPLSGDDVYDKALEELVWPVLREFKPDLIMVSLGFDAHEGDTIANLRLSLNSYLKIYRGLASLGVGLIYVLEGGYNYYVLSTGSRLLIDTMRGNDVELIEEATTTIPSIYHRGKEVINNIKRILRNYWNI